jgi:hypothetical protein
MIMNVCATFEKDVPISTSWIFVPFQQEGESMQGMK